MKDTTLQRVAEHTGASKASLLIDGLWMRCGLQIGGLNRDDAMAQIETVLERGFPNDPERLAAREKMRSIAQAFIARKA